MASIRVTRIDEREYALDFEGKRRVRDAARWIVVLARVGYFAKGILYLVIGGLATLAAIGSGGTTTDSRGALAIIGSSPVGHALLLAMGVGLVGYGCWALVAAATDAERRGSDGKGIALRVGLAARGLGYGALGVEAIRLFLTARASRGDGAQHWTAQILALPLGPWIVGGVGAAIVSYALYQWWRAARKNLRKRLRLEETSPTMEKWVIRLARFGIAARGVVFLLIGWFLIQAAVRYDPSRAAGIDESLAALARQPYGLVTLAVVAFGLMAYGVWQLVEGRFREMRVA